VVLERMIIMTEEYDLWNIDDITVSIDGNWVHVRCSKEHAWIEISDCYYFSLFQRIIYSNINKFTYKCINKIKSS
jgi:hypothetical protein